MAIWARALPRRLLGGGAPGDARSAGAHVIASNVVIQLAARVLTLSIGIVTTALTARTLNPTGYGVWNGVGSYVGLFGVITDLGFTVAAMQRMSAEPERESAWLGALAISRTILALVAMSLCAISVPLFLSDAHGEHAVAYILTTTGVTAGASALMSVFQSRLRAGLVLSFSILQSVAWLVCVVALYELKGDPVDFAIAAALVSFFIAAVQLQATRRLAHIAWRAGMALWRTLLRLAIPLGISAAAITIYNQIDSVLLLQVSGPHEAGVYGAAYGFLAPLAFLPAAVMGSFFPVLAATYGHDPDRARRLVQACTDTLGILSLPVLAGSIALAGPIVHLLYGDAFARSAGLLPILMIAFVLSSFGSLAGFLSSVLGVQWRLALSSSVGAALNIGLNLAFIPAYGAYGSAWATVATEAVTMTFMLGQCLIVMRVRLRVWTLAKAFVLAEVMTLVMVLAKPLGLFPAGILGILVYVGGLFAARIVNLDELRALRRMAPS